MVKKIVFLIIACLGVLSCANKDNNTSVIYNSQILRFQNYDTVISMPLYKIKSTYQKKRIDTSIKHSEKLDCSSNLFNLLCEQNIVNGFSCVKDSVYTRDAGWIKNLSNKKEYIDNYKKRINMYVIGDIKISEQVESLLVNIVYSIETNNFNEVFLITSQNHKISSICQVAQTFNGEDAICSYTLIEDTILSYYEEIISTEEIIENRGINNTIKAEFTINEFGKIIVKNKN